ncbi:hypothetical protein RvVAR0630_pl07010 (plasmid) [Agrobacterium vitis]|uniref:LysR family transcriptional regulator substrate-binding protein n=1 Tax=Agrobacterium vitis TaxID=373 RepID=UPI0015D8A379|nr:LysR family transcriptional regulator substrate-binding protein [Agrobacterium vitis]BCH62559.1 hypothetical protein RvVAR0630_pl07010 [Agrobacterium vitis]
MRPAFVNIKGSGPSKLLGWETFTAYAEEILSLSQEARSAVASIAGSADNNLTIGALETIARSTLPECLTMFREQHPNVTVSLKVAASGDLLQQVETGMIDVAFCFDRGSFDNRLATRLIAKEPVILIAPITGQYARDMPTLTEIGAVSFVATEVGCVYRAMFDKAFADFGHCL